MMHAYRSLCLKHIFHYFVFNQFLHDILSLVHIFFFYFFSNFITFLSVFKDALRIYRQLTAYSTIMPSVWLACAALIMCLRNL